MQKWVENNVSLAKFLWRFSYMGNSGKSDQNYYMNESFSYEKGQRWNYPAKS